MKKLLCLVFIAVLICSMLNGCIVGDENPTTEPTDPTEPTQLIEPSLIERDCELFSIALPKNLVEEKTGKMFADREASVGVAVNLESKDFYPNMTLKDYAQFICDTLEAEEISVVTNTEFETPSFTVTGDSFFLDNYMKAGVLYVFYETDECFILLSFACLQSEYESRMAEFKEWIATIRIYDEPSGNVYNDAQEEAWDFFDLTLHLDSSFKAVEDRSDFLSLTNHLGDWIAVFRYEKKSSEQAKNLWQCYEIASNSFEEVEMLADTTIRYSQNFTNVIDFASSGWIFETDRFWYFVEFSAPKDEYDSRVDQFERWKSAIELSATAVISTPKANATAATKALHKDIFGSEPAEITQVYENEQIAISVAKMAGEKCAVYAAKKDAAWQTMQIFNYETVVLGSAESYRGCAYRIGDWIAVIIYGVSTEVNDTLDSVLIDLPECNARLLVLPSDLPEDYKLSTGMHVLIANGSPFDIPMP